VRALARLKLNVETWPVPLRWGVAMIVVPMVPFLIFAAAAGFLWLLGGWTLSFLLFAIATPMLLFIPAAWLSFLPAYFAIDRWGRHSRRTYVRSAMLAAVVGAGLISGHHLLTDPHAPEGLPWFAFGLVVALPTSAWMGRAIWCTLWSGREPEGTAN